MSRRAEGRVRAASVLLVVGALLGSSTSAQTIGDYSRVQRDAIDKAMARSGASAAAADGAPAPAPVPPPAVLAPPARPASMSAPTLGVSGVFASASRVVAEVVVDGSAYLLSSGQRVPGTSWRVEAVSAGQVVLGRVDGRALRTFALLTPPRRMP